MRGYVTDWRGREWLLPYPTQWELEYTAGVPCDSFTFRCPWEMGGETAPGDWVRFSARYQGKDMFNGVVDECQVTLDQEAASWKSAAGAGGPAAGQRGHWAGLRHRHPGRTSSRDHVTPYGIQTAPGAALPAVTRFSVATGSSEWSVVYDFARYYGGVCPRFDRLGRLVLSGWQDSQERLVEDGTPVTTLVRRDRRYGVLSRVLVRDRWSGAVQRVDNGDFLSQGGSARRVLTMPGRSNYKTMRYNGQFQLDRSASEQERVELTIAQPFCAWPGDLVSIRRSKWDWNGRYRVLQSATGMGMEGAWTRLELALPDFVV